MKTPFSFLLLFLFLLGFGQNPAIKIYVADAENSKNISNAKVCLEGFEIPAIKAQYKKKEKYYYFTEIPKNYNTVMVYHKKYNEKGFQDMNGLPKELKFKLHEPLQNYYDFDYETSDEQPNKKFYNYYVEDPYKIVLRPKVKMNYNDFRNYIYQFIQDNNIEIEPINPFLKEKNTEDLEPYPILYSPCINKYNDDCVESYDKRDDGKAKVFPLIDNSSNDQLGACRDEYKLSPNGIAFFFRKKDGKKFKRYNDQIIAKLEKDINLNVLLVVYSRGVYDEQSKIRQKKYFKYKDKQNKLLYSKIDSSKVFFYNTNLPIRKHKPFYNRSFLFKVFHKRNIYFPYEPNVPSCKGSYVLVEKNYSNIFYVNETFFGNFFYEADQKGISRLKVFEELNEKKKYPDMKIDEVGLGLGIADKYEYYYNKNIQK